MNKKNRSSGNLEKWISELVYIAVINDLRSLTVFPGKKEKRCSKFGWFLWKPHQKIRMTVKAAIFVITDLGFKKPTYREKVTMSLDCNWFFSELDIYAQIDIKCYIQGQRKWYQIMHWSTRTNSSVWPIPYAYVQPYHSAVAAIGSCFVLIGAHRHGIAVGSMTGGKWPYRGVGACASVHNLVLKRKWLEWMKERRKKGKREERGKGNEWPENERMSETPKTEERNR